MIRKHTRRAAKAAFAISLGVAIVIGLFAAVVARPAHANRGARRSRSAPRTSPRSTSSASSTSRPWRRRASRSPTRRTSARRRSIQTALTSGKINFYPEYTGVIVQDVFHHTNSPKTAAATYRAREAARGGEGLHAPEPDAVLRHRRRRGDERDGEEVRAEHDRRPEEGRQLQARRLPRVPDAEHVLRRLHEAVRAHERDVRCRSPGISAYAALDAGNVLAADVFSTDPPLGKGSKYTVLDRSEARDRLPERGPDRRDLGRDGAGSKFTTTVNAVSAKLTLPAIVAMNKAVEVDKQTQQRSRRRS